MREARETQELRRRTRTAFDKQASTFDSTAKGSHARSLYPYIVEEVISAVAGIEKPRLLDLGCGTGALAKLVTEEIPECRLTGIDLSSRMVEVARTRLEGKADVFIADAESLPFPEGEFDAIYCNDSFHHYTDPKRAAFEAWRVLGRGGSLVIGDVWQPLPARVVMNAWMPHSSEGDVRIYSEQEMREMLATWFESVSWRSVRMRSCVCIARKG